MTDDPVMRRLAQRMYEAMENKVVPRWDQLGGVTQGVWIERALRRLSVQRTERKRVVMPVERKRAIRE